VEVRDSTTTIEGQSYVYTMQSSDEYNGIIPVHFTGRIVC